MSLARCCSENQETEPQELGKLGCVHGAPWMRLSLLQVFYTRLTSP